MAPQPVAPPYEDVLWMTSWNTKCPVSACAFATLTAAVMAEATVPPPVTFQLVSMMSWTTVPSGNDGLLTSGLLTSGFSVLLLTSGLLTRGF